MPDGSKESKMNSKRKYPWKAACAIFIFTVFSLTFSHSSAFYSSGKYRWGRSASPYVARTRRPSPPATSLKGIYGRYRYKPSHVTVKQTLIGPHVCEQNKCCSGWTSADTAMCITPICPVSCKNGGYCIAPKKCLCPSLYSGSDCSTRKSSSSTSTSLQIMHKRKRGARQTIVHVRYGDDPLRHASLHAAVVCTPATCFNGGTCIDGSCICKLGYEGKKCEKVVVAQMSLDSVLPGQSDEPSSSEQVKLKLCNALCVHGTCTVGSGAICQCHPGYYGTMCQSWQHGRSKRKHGVAVTNTQTGWQYNNNFLRPMAAYSKTPPRRIPISTPRSTISPKYGKCYRTFRGNVCGLSYARYMTVGSCCKTGLGDGWGPSCITCRKFNFQKIAQAGRVAKLSLRCPKGFTNLNGICKDINECLMRRNVCENGLCVNSRGSYWCKCNRGYHQHLSRSLCLADRMTSRKPITASSDYCYLSLDQYGGCGLSGAVVRGKKRICCCSVGLAWGASCETCPKRGTVEYAELCPSGSGYVKTVSYVSRPRRPAKVPVTAKYFATSTRAHINQPMSTTTTSTTDPQPRTITAKQASEGTSTSPMTTTPIMTTIQPLTHVSKSPRTELVYTTDDLSVAASTSVERESPTVLASSTAEPRKETTALKRSTEYTAASTEPPTSTDEGTEATAAVVYSTDATTLTRSTPTHIVPKGVSQTTSTETTMSQSKNFPDIASTTIDLKDSAITGIKSLTTTDASPAATTQILPSRATSSAIAMEATISTLPVLSIKIATTSASVNAVGNVHDTPTDGPDDEYPLLDDYDVFETIELEENSYTDLDQMEVIDSDADIDLISDVQSSPHFGATTVNATSQPNDLLRSTVHTERENTAVELPTRSVTDEEKTTTLNMSKEIKGDRNHTPQPVNETCSPNPCQNQGECVIKGDLSFKCKCAEGYFGITCEIKDYCVPDRCLNGATCETGMGFYYCDCTDGYVGRNCEGRILNCKSNPCTRGTCKDTEGGYRCACERGSEGINCDQDIDECSRNSSRCENGRCVNTDGSYRCECNIGYILDAEGQCEVFFECNSVDCGAEATCRNLPGSYECVCPNDDDTYDVTKKECLSPHSGELDTQEIRKPCYSTPRFCKNFLSKNITQRECCCTIGRSWGDCNTKRSCPRVMTDAFKEMCPVGRGLAPGKKIEVEDMNECELFGSDRICRNGQCTNSFGGYKCTCFDGFYYNRRIQACDDINECRLRSKCVGGYCINLRGSFKCQCPRGTVLRSIRYTSTCIGTQSRRRMPAIIRSRQNARQPRSKSGKSGLKHFCFSRVLPNSMCSGQLPSKHTYEECCCAVGIAWGASCSKCPERRTDDYRFLCHHHPPMGNLKPLVRVKSTEEKTGAMDIDECQELKHVCLNGVCLNQPGASRCICRAGFESVGSGTTICKRAHLDTPDYLDKSLGTSTDIDL